MIYNIVLISAVQQSDSVIYIFFPLTAMWHAES